MRFVRVLEKRANLKERTLLKRSKNFNGPNIEFGFAHLNDPKYFLAFQMHV